MNTPSLLFVEITPMKSGQLQAFADVTLTCELGELTIRGCRVLCAPGEQPWISFPSVSYEKDGQKKYKDVLEFSRGFRKQLVDAILQEYHKSGGA